MMPPLVEVAVAACLLGSGALVLASAYGFVRPAPFFLRMHPPALAYTLASWLVSIAASGWFTWQRGAPVLLPLLVPVFLAVTVPVTTVLLSRVALFRGRIAGATGMPPPLSRAGDSVDAGVAPKTPVP